MRSIGLRGQAIVPWKGRLQFLTYARYYICSKLNAIKKNVGTLNETCYFPR